MRVISSDHLLNAQGEPALIGVIGSCRVHGPMRALMAEGEVRLIAMPFSCYTHTPHEALQYIRYCQGELAVPTALRAMIFGRENMRPTTRPFVDLVARLDAIVIEVSGLRRLSASGFELQQNYFSTNFIRSGGKPYLDWWRGVVSGDSRLSDHSEQLIEQQRSSGLLPSHQDVIRTARFHEIDWEDFTTALDALAQTHPARICLVSHFNIPGDAEIEERSKTIRFLSRAAEEFGHGFFDPTQLVGAHGAEKALKAGGKDRYHFAPEFEPTVGRSLLAKVREVLSAPVPTLNGHVDTQSMDGLLPDIASLDTADLRRLIQSPDRAIRPEMRDVLCRELLDREPGDSSLAVRIAEHALQTDRPQSCLTYADIALHSAPGNARAEAVRARAYASMGVGDLVESIEKAIDAGDMETLEHLAATLKGLPRQAPQRAQLAELIARQRDRLARIDDGTDYHAAIPVLEILRRLDTEQRNHWAAKLGELRTRLTIDAREAFAEGRLDQALRLTDAMIGHGIALEAAHMTQGRIHHAQADYDKAAAAFEACLAINPQNAWVSMSLARALLKTGDVARAARAFLATMDKADPETEAGLIEDASATLGTMGSAIVNRARALEAEATTPGQISEVYELYEIAARGLGERVDFANLTANLRRKCLLQVIDLEKSDDRRLPEMAEQLLKMEPDNVRALRLAGSFLSRHREHARALPHWQRLTRLDPDTAINHLQVARCFNWLGMNDRMHEAAAKALHFDPDNTEAASLLAETVSVEGDE